MSASRVRKNKFCKLRNLRNESDVEQNFIVRLLDDLGFTDDYRETKTTLHTVKVDKGKRQRKYIPDYVCFLDKAHKRPVLVVDAKSPTDAAMSGATDAQLYASVIRRSLSAPYPVELAGRLIRMFSFAGDTILDPFAGSCSTLVAAIHAGRNSIGIDIEPSYVEDATGRIEKELQAHRFDANTTASLSVF